jgi:hypothetical protein
MSGREIIGLSLLSSILGSFVWWFFCFGFCVMTDDWLKRIKVWTYPDVPENPLQIACVFIPTIFPVLTLMGLFHLTKNLSKSVQPLFSSVLTEGVFLMKRRIFMFLLQGALWYGVLETGFISKTYHWFADAPPPPSAEAQKLIASLNSAEGWEAKEGKDGPGTLTKGGVSVTAKTWRTCNLASIRVNGTKANEEFGWSDCRAINEAARKCLRKVTANSLTESTEKTSRILDGEYTAKNGVLYVKEKTAD